MRIFDAIIEFGFGKTTILPVPEADKTSIPESGIILHFNGTYSEVMHEQLASNCTDNPRNLFIISVEIPIFD